MSVVLEVEKNPAKHQIVVHCQKTGKPTTYPQSKLGDTHAIGVYGTLQFSLAFYSSDKITDLLNQVEFVGPPCAFHRRSCQSAAFRSAHRA